MLKKTLKLKTRQKKKQTFHKVAARLVGFDYDCQHLADGQQEADFIANHSNGEKHLKVKIMPRLTISRKHEGKGYHCAFIQRKEVCGKITETAFLYDHDELIRQIECDKRRTTLKTNSWRIDGLYNWYSPPKWALECIEPL